MPGMGNVLGVQAGSRAVQMTRRVRDLKDP